MKLGLYLARPRNRIIDDMNRLKDKVFQMSDIQMIFDLLLLLNSKLFLVYYFPDNISSRIGVFVIENFD